MSGNSSNAGGGIVNDAAGTVTITNSTLSGNSAGGPYYDGVGGGISNNATLTIINSTLSGNSALNQGGGIYNSTSVSNPILTIGNTILNAGSSGGTFITDSATDAP